MDVKSSNITWHHSKVSREDREKRSRHKGAVIWLTGLPCSGKSTIAVSLEEKLFQLGCNVYILDGDNIRHGLNSNLGFSPQDREENIRRIGEVAKLFYEAGVMVITAFVSPYKKDRDNVRTKLPKGDFIEVYVKCDIAACENRDTKGLYKKARNGEVKDFTGVSAPYEEPLNPELVIDTSSENIEESVGHLLDYIKMRGYILKER
jgi:adenylyl-sulfate kinase